MPLIRPVTRVAALTTMLVLNACATFTPGSIDKIPIRERAQTLEQDGLQVSVAVLNSDEARQLFDANIYARGVQPVWIEIDNQTDNTYWLMLHGLDPNYFSANEVAYMNHQSFGGKANKAMDAFFSGQAIDQTITPGSVSSGFAFSGEAMGTKEVRIRLYDDHDIRDFEFFVSVPGQASEWQTKDLSKLYGDEELVHLDTQEELRAALTALPCCLQQELGQREGQPVNVVLIGGLSMIRALIKSGWDETIFLTDLRSSFGAEYLYGRQPDIQFAKTRRRVDSTLSLQLWVTQLRYQGEPVAVGSVKRSIDPDTDEAAMFLFEDLATAGRIERVGIVAGVPPVSKESPKRTYADEAYWTTGGRVVLQTSSTPKQLDELRLFDWDWEGRQESGAATPPDAPEKKN